MPFPGHLGREAEFSELERVQLWNNLYLANLPLVLAQGSHLPPCFWLFQLPLGVLFQTHLCWWFMDLAPAGWTWCVCGYESCRTRLLSWDWNPPVVPKFSVFHFVLLDRGLPMSAIHVFINEVLFIWLRGTEYGVTSYHGPQSVCCLLFLSFVHYVPGSSLSHLSPSTKTVLTVFPECVCFIIFKRGCWDRCMVWCFSPCQQVYCFLHGRREVRERIPTDLKQSFLLIHLVNLPRVAQWVSSQLKDRWCLFCLWAIVKVQLTSALVCVLPTLQPYRAWVDYQERCKSVWLRGEAGAGKGEGGMSHLKALCAEPLKGSWACRGKEC